MNSADSFSADYTEARAKFLAEAAQHDGDLAAYAHPERGPTGGDLSTDVAWFGPRDAEAVLVMISATHGVEGFCGSGAQVDFLRRGETARLPSGLAVMMIHAINPYGFAWLRRVTHENVDLNRNWIPFNGPKPVNAGYDELYEALCPKDWSPEILSAAERALLAYGQREGFPAMAKALTGGQYNHADGIFYGGREPTWSRLTQTQIFAEHLGKAGRIGILDYHTGLGPWGYAEQIATVAPSHPEFARAQAWYGAAVTSTQDGTSASAEIAGDGLGAAPALLAHAEVTTLALEVGTLPGPPITRAMLADNWLHAHGDPLGPDAPAIKAALRDAFYGDADDWKGMVAGQSLIACRQAIAGLTRA
ncbi:MAG: M14 family metallopeptidase [Caulobacteraceae bacterium]